MVSTYIDRIITAQHILWVVAALMRTVIPHQTVSQIVEGYSVTVTELLESANTSVSSLFPAKIGDLLATCTDAELASSNRKILGTNV
jgi:hypothetical protein